MGNDCLASTPNQYYRPYLEKVNVSQLKDLWQTIKLYKIKKIYDSHSVKPYSGTESDSDSESKNSPTHIPFENFLEMFPEFNRYEEIHKRRLFEIFDHGNLGQLNWENFYSTITLCYFASEEILSVFMFMVFDESLAKKLNADQLRLLIDLNAFCIGNESTKENDNQMQLDLDPQEIFDELWNKCCGNGDPKDVENGLTIDQWLTHAKRYFDFSKYRRLFNVFKEEILEKQLISNFNQWNDLYVEESEKYISYVVSYKWFETWKIYVEDSYGVKLNSNTLKQTCKSLKTRKTQKKLKSMKKIASSKTLKEIPVPTKSLKNLQHQESKLGSKGSQRIKNIDFIHSNIGERPREIYNNVIEGEYEQVLRTQLVENRDYALVSERVWKSLQQIYGGGPQFRRTGFDSIQLYPKVVKVYSTLFRNQIDYSSEVIREASGYITIRDLLSRSLDIEKQNLDSKKIFFKTIGMIKWQQIHKEEFDCMFMELSSEIIIHLIYLNDGEEVQQFRKSHLKMTKDISEVNVGDYVTYRENCSGNGIGSDGKTAIYMGKNIEGKYILHFPRQSYIYDKCLIESDVMKKCSILDQQIVVPSNMQSQVNDKNNQNVNLKLNKNQCDIKGISNVKGLGFINSTILNLFNNKKFKDFLTFSMPKVNPKNISYGKQESQSSQSLQFGTSMLEILLDIYKVLSLKKSVDIREIQDIIEFFLPNYKNFEISLCQSFLNDFLQYIGQQIAEVSESINAKGTNTIVQDYQIKVEKVKKCLKCSTVLKDTEQSLSLELPLSDEADINYFIAFVPINTTMKCREIKRYGIRLKTGATLKQLKDQFEKIAEIDSSKRSYVLTEVYSDKIIKNFNSTDPNLTLEKLKIRQGDALIAYELYTDFQKFISSHYSKNSQLAEKDVKPDNFIDCLHRQKGWIFGKVCEVEYLPYTQQCLIKVLHKYSKNDQWEVCYDFTDESVSKFPVKCYRNAEQYHLQLTQRYFNEATNEMQVCNMPLVIVLTSWMRWKEFNYLIYLQVRRFIQRQYDFDAGDEGQEGDEEGEFDQIRLTSYKDLTQSGKKSTKKVNSNSNSSALKAQKFREFLNNEKQLPYKLSLIDAEGRCAICFLFLKTSIFKGQNETYCKGCTLSQSEPISWQIKVADIKVAIDWKNLSHMSRNVVKQHSSLINLRSTVNSTQSKNCKQSVNEESIEACLNNRLKPIVEEDELLCCNKLEKVESHEKITKFPQILPIFLSRITIQEDGYKKINKNQVKFTEKLKIQNAYYALTGVTSIEGNNRNIKYRTYQKRDLSVDQWLEIDGEYCKKIPFNTVQNICALTLYYQRQK